MYRGTTPTLKFTLPFAASTLDEIWITLGQLGKEVLTKTKTSCTIDGKTVSVTLTQEDTLKLTAYRNEPTLIQIRIKTNDGTALASKVFTVPTENILKDGVI